MLKYISLLKSMFCILYIILEKYNLYCNINAIYTIISIIYLKIRRNKMTNYEKKEPLKYGNILNINIAIL